MHDHHRHEGDPPTDAASWDELYREADHVWSGAPNQALVDEVHGMAPGRAVEVGCGEGADAVWLAGLGWDVTAIDISAVAIERAEAAARARGVTVTWVVADVADHPPPVETADLVISFYASIPVARADRTVVALTGAVAPGGTLLVVHHDFDETDDLPFDPADYMSVDDVAGALGSEWVIEVHETRERVTPGHGRSPDVPDEVLRARRRS